MVQQPTSLTRSVLDGFGRTIRVENGAGVKTTTRYDALGRKTFESLPFEGTAEVGTTYTYDALGRVRRVLRGNGQETTYTHGNGGTVTTLERIHPSTGPRFSGGLPTAIPPTRC